MPPTRAVAKKKKAAARKKAKKVADAALALAVEVVPMKEPKKKKKAAAKKKKAAAPKKKRERSSSSKPRAPRVRKPSAILREATPHESATEHDEYMRRYAGVIDRRSGRFKGVTRGDWERFFERDPVTKRIGRRDKTREWPVHKQLAARADKAPRVISTVPLRPPPAGGGGGKKKGGKKKAAAPKKKKAAAPKKKKAAAPKKKPFFEKPAKKPRAGNKKKAAAPALLKEVPRAALPDGMEWIESRLNEARVPTPSVLETSTPLPPPPDNYPPPPALPVEALVQPASEADEHYAGARRIGRGSVKRGGNMDEPVAALDTLPDALANWTTMQSVRLSLQGSFYRLMDIAMRLLRRLRPGDSVTTLEDTMFEMLDRAKDRLDEKDLEPIRAQLLPKVPYAQTQAVIDRACEEDPNFRQDLIMIYQDLLKNKRLKSVIEAIDKQLPSSQRATVEAELAKELAEAGAAGEKA